MSHTPHELAEEFPELSNEMTALRQSDSHFANLSDSYHTLNRAIHRAETDVEPTGDEHMVEMRKERLALKDQIYTYIKAHAKPV
ncbi:MAG: YdcH family protein [Sulfitobacter sp.]